MTEGPPQSEERAPRSHSGRIRIEETDAFERPGFTGHVYLKDDEGAGFGALEVRVHDSHPEKVVQVESRAYVVLEGSGTFVIDGATHDAKPGDMLLIRKGSSYSYKANDGHMKLFELNIPLAKEEEG